MGNLSILVVDDHEVTRCGICVLLASHPAWRICGQAADGQEAIDKALELRPDVVVMDLFMPVLDGLAATRTILSRNPRQRILMVTMCDSELVMIQALRTGVSGFVLKSELGSQLVEAVEALENHRKYFSIVVENTIFNAFLNCPKKKLAGRPLTTRELEIMQLVVCGKSSREVASLLSLSAKTIETHRQHIMRKTNSHTIAELVLYAVRNEMVKTGTNPVSESTWRSNQCELS